MTASAWPNSGTMKGRCRPAQKKNQIPPHAFASHAEHAPLIAGLDETSAAGPASPPGKPMASAAEQQRNSAPVLVLVHLDPDLRDVLDDVGLAHRKPAERAACARRGRPGMGAMRQRMLAPEAAPCLCNSARTAAAHHFSPASATSAGRTAEQRALRLVKRHSGEVNKAREPM